MTVAHIHTNKENSTTTYLGNIS